MDDSLEIKKMERSVVELLVEIELINMSQESATAAINSITTKKYDIPNVKQYARKIIAIVKEHSL